LESSDLIVQNKQKKRGRIMSDQGRKLVAKITLEAKK